MSFIIVILLIRFNSKLPGRDPVQEALDRYFEGKNARTEDNEARSD
jgi:hypothetical protein